MTNSPRILVVEDDREISALFDLFLEQRGYRPLIANDAAVGGEILRTIRPHLMIADVMAGCGRGANVVALAQQAGVPVLLMSGDPAAIEARLDGPVPFLEKPFGLVELEQAIDGLLAGGTPRARRAIRRAPSIRPKATCCRWRNLSRGN